MVLGDEALATEMALVVPLSAMDLHMPHQLGVLVKSSITYRTTHFLDFSVLFHVIAEVAVSGKHLLTDEALKVPFACMGDLMRYQMDLLPERLVTGLAGELFHSCVYK